jgi:hypothetical protein
MAKPIHIKVLFLQRQPTPKPIHIKEMFLQRQPTHKTINKKVLSGTENLYL